MHHGHNSLKKHLTDAKKKCVFLGKNLQIEERSAAIIRTPADPNAARLLPLPRSPGDSCQN